MLDDRHRRDRLSPLITGATSKPDDGAPEEPPVPLRQVDRYGIDAFFRLGPTEYQDARDQHVCRYARAMSTPQPSAVVFYSRSVIER